MADLQQIQDDIDALLRDAAYASREQVVALAETYAIASREAQERLHRCAQYLDHGMRSEALHLAESPPSLLHGDTKTQLVHPAGWEALCSMHGQRCPALLRGDVLDRLSAAADLDRRLAPLLSRNRLLALGRGSLSGRLRVVRALRKADPDNPVWPEQLRVLERSRLEELHADADAAITKTDVTVLAKLVAELESPEWVTHPDPAWMDALRHRVAGYRRSAALDKLPAKELRAAFAARDYEQCVTLLSRWQSIMDRHALTLPEGLQREIREISGWIATESRRRTMEQRRAAGPATEVPAPQANPLTRAAGAVRRAFKPGS